MPPHLLGIDLGTSACKAELFGVNGDLIGSAIAKYPLHRLAPLWAEQDPQDWWDAAKLAIGEVLASTRIPASMIEGIGIGGTTNGHVLLDKKASVLRRAIIWQDRRATEEAEWLRSRISPDAQIRFWGTLLPIDSSITPARILWIKKHEPATLEATDRMLQPKDYLNFKLTGEDATDLVSSKTMTNLKEKRYCDEFFSLLAIPKSIMPVAHEPHEVIGEVSTTAAAETGLTKGTPVVAGCIDAWCNILGVGAIKHGLASDTAGTSEVISVMSCRPVFTQILNVIPSFGLFVLNGPTQSGGDSLRWFRDAFVRQVDDQGASHYDILDKEVQSVEPGAGGLVFLPYLQGERAPVWDSHAKGVFIGITKLHSRPHFTRAVMEGVAFSVRHVLDTAELVGHLQVSEVRLSGRASQSQTWNRIKADVTGRQLIKTDQLETGTLGAAMLAGIGAGLYRGYEHAAQECVHISAVFEPDIRNHDRYFDLFQVYKDLYPCLKEVFPRLTP